MREKKLKIINVVGARPNFIKIKPLLDAMRKFPQIKPLLLHTGQHYDFNMSEVFFKGLQIPKPDINLEIGSHSHAKQTAIVMERFEEILLKEKPDWVVVVGDVNSSLACALTAAKLNVKIAHVEAGMRSFDKTMPEEINRVLIDHLADVLFTTHTLDNDNLLREGIARKQIVLAGNVMADALHGIIGSKISLMTKAAQSDYAVVTIHRQENVDNKDVLTGLCRVIQNLAKEIKIYFPVHPRTRQRLAQFSCLPLLNNVTLMDPQGYVEFVKLYSKARFVMTDSGGIQTETTILNVPCFTVRNTTEWNITCTNGTNVLVGTNEKKIIKAIRQIFHTKAPKRKPIPFWDGKASDRIVRYLLSYSK